MKKRLVSLVLAVAVLCGMICVVPSASAVTPWEHFYEVLHQSILDGFGISLDRSEFIFPLVGQCTEEDLLFAQDRYNSWLATILRSGSTIGSVFDVVFNTHRAVIAEDKVNNRRRLQDSTTGEWIVDYNGQYPYVPIQSNDTAPDWATKPAPNCPVAPEISSKSGNLWLELAPMQDKLQSGVLSGNTSYNYTQLTDLLKGLRERFPNVNYRLAPVFGGSYGVCKNNLVLCDSAGRPFIAFKSDDSSAANQTQNVYVKNDGGGDLLIGGDKVTTDIKILDKSQNTLNIPVTDNSSSVSIEDFIHQDIYNTSYNFDDHSYTVNTYDVTYNNDNRVYETNYYTWNITYNITNTYVTYIGSNDAYQQKEYEFYYELPDGRDSADLTADEVAAMSFQFADCMNYQRSATDTNLRALYHFDGNLEDAGFFSDKTSFEWVSGASITYMDSSTFNGALYLDETAHQFKISLPSNVRAGEDFTVQFRYYQASEPDTQDNVNNVVSLGSATFKWDERNLYGNSSSPVCALPVGNWVELAMVRHNGTIYLYLNGVKVSSWTNAAALGKVLTFTFGTTSRAYSMVDELRILNFPLVSGGSSYTPTAVPYDSNLVLVLPGEEKVADEYWEFSSPNNLIPRPDFTEENYALSTSYVVGEWCFRSYDSMYSPDSVVWDNGCFSLGSSSSSSSSLNYGNVPYGFFYYLWLASGSDLISRYPSGITATDFNSTTYTFSVVDASGEVYSLTFPFNSSYRSASFPWGKLEYRYDRHSSSRNEGRAAIFITPAAGKSIDVIYTELVKGSSSQVVATKVAAVFDLSSLKPNTAAVQTDIPIHGYTVGGVRPTFPVRGDVWFGVTNGRVSTVQVYTGSAWTSSNARWWTGTRWIPIYAFDIFTLEDCWDIADGDDVITPIESDTAGWNWWKKAWTDFRSWLGGVFGGGTPVEPSPSPSPTPTPTPSPSPSGPVIDDRPLMLAPGVKIVRENSDTWEAVNAASVTITMETGNLWGSNNTVHNLFTIDFMNGASSDDIFVSLDVDGLPLNEGGQWDNASFMLFIGDNNYVSLGKKSHVPGFTITEEFAASGTEYPGSSSHNNVTSATLAFHKKGDTIRTFFRPFGGSWEEGETITTDHTFYTVGFACWQYFDRGKTVTFSNLRMTTASRYALVEDFDTMLTSFVANTSVVPFFLGGGFEVIGGGASEGAPSDGAPFRDQVKDDTLVDEDGNEVSVFGLMGKIGSALWFIVTKLFGVVFGGVIGFFKLITDSVGGFFDVFDGGLGLASKGVFPWS